MKEIMKNIDKIYNRKIKRVIDFILATIVFISMLPLFTILSFFIVLDSGFPVFYCGERVGYLGKVFKIYKFRTMIPNADKIGGGTTAWKDPRITSIGNFLRKTKMDEIAQLINIIKGDMSFVGPRPELKKYVDRYDEKEKKILQVRPGITDYASLKFINLDILVGSHNADKVYENTILKEKNKLRLRYAEEISFHIDVKLFFFTIYYTLKKGLKYMYKPESM